MGNGSEEAIAYEVDQREAGVQCRSPSSQRSCMDL